MSGNDCEIQSDIGEPKGTHVGAPYGLSDDVPPGLKLLLALIDNSHWPLHVEGDTGVGKESRVDEGATIPCENITALDPGPIPDGVFPEGPNYSYPGVGITAYGCQMGCNYIIVGNLGASVIVGKIDGQWHILRVIASGSTTPLFGPSNECRCCGNALKDVKLRAKIFRVTPDGCGPYRACDEFRIDPLSTQLGHNPMQLSLKCESTPESILENLNDWSATAFGSSAVVKSIKCCNQYAETNCYRTVDEGFELCICEEIDPDGSGSGSGDYLCRFEMVIEFTHEGCEYTVLIYHDIADIDDDPCVEFADEFIEDVVMEAPGLPYLEPGDRVIMAKIPGGLAGRTALNGIDPIEWFLIRACNVQDCANQCDEPSPPEISPCCGKPCDELPTTLSATIEVLSSDCPCPSGTSFGATLTRRGNPELDCSGAANIRWSVSPTSDSEPPEIVGCINNPGGVPPTKIRLANLELKCADNTADACGDGASGSALGPNMILEVFHFNSYAATTVGGSGLATQDRVVSCCSPFFVQYEITGNYCYGAGASTVTAPTTLRITITG